MDSQQNTEVCPGCGRSARLSPFYELRGAPVYACLLVGTAAEALQVPRADIVLTSCDHCGFVWNRAFDPSYLDCPGHYESSQAFSPTFQAFANDLASSWIDRYDLHGKRVLEIGCGSGEFLVLLCQLGANQGIGFDPAYRRDPDAAPLQGVEFVADHFSEEYHDIPADFLYCRHTLEHVPKTGEFLWMVRRSIGERLDTVVCFEVPDLSRIVDRAAFWDVYYEHCSYFTAESLAALFRICAFDVLDVRLVYGHQYIVIEAKPSSRRPGREPPAAIVEDFKHRLTRFARRSGRRIADWKTRIGAWQKDRCRSVLWGSGSKAVGFLTAVGGEEAVDGIVDVNPRRHGKFMPGCPRPIVAPCQLREVQPQYVVVMNPLYAHEIGRALRHLGITAEVLVLE